MNIETKDLTLTVERQVPGELVTNALAIEAFVAERIKDFIPEEYYDDPEAAKKDRAVLNAAAKDLNARRLSLEREFNAPFEPVKAAIKRATDMLTLGADKLGEVWSAVEETKRNEKRREIEQAWTATAFDLFPLSRVFDDRWLNKGTKMPDVIDAINAVIARTYKDLRTIETAITDEKDAATIKALYLESLDIGEALAKGQAIKANRDRLAKEAAERTEREAAATKQQALDDLAKEADAELEADRVAPLAAAALAEEGEAAEFDPIVTKALRFRGTRAQLLGLKQYMADNGIQYETIVDQGVA